MLAQPSGFSKAVMVWTQADKGMKTDEAQIGHRGLHVVDSSTVKTSSQSMHSKACFRFMISSGPATLIAEQLLILGSRSMTRFKCDHEGPPSVNISGESQMFTDAKIIAAARRF